MEEKIIKLLSILIRESLDLRTRKGFKVAIALLSSLPIPILEMRVLSVPPVASGLSTITANYRWKEDGIVDQRLEATVPLTKWGLGNCSKGQTN